VVSYTTLALLCKTITLFFNFSNFFSEAQMSRKIKFRLRVGDKIVGYEWWSHSDWYYRQDNEEWSKDFIPHTDKDQFTGLHDNGKEIYEGDVIENANSVRLEIYWDEDACAFGQRTKDDKLPMAYNLKTIIGNIHANPELLNQ